MRNILVSIIIPCYGQARYVPAAVASVQQQHIDAVEIIVVDDGSPDDTTSVVRQLTSTDPRVRLVRKANGGLSSARNAGIDAARGRYLQFLDADDLLLPGKLQHELSLLSTPGGPQVVYSDFHYTDLNGVAYRNHFCRPRFVGHDVEIELALRWEMDLSIPIHCFLFDAALFSAHDLRFDAALPNHEDWDMWLRLFALQPRVLGTGIEGAAYRATPGAMTRNHHAMYRGYLMAIDKHAEMAAQRPAMARAMAAKRSLTRHQYGYGWHAGVWKVLLSPLVTTVLPWRAQLALRKVTRADIGVHRQAVFNHLLARDR